MAISANVGERASTSHVSSRSTVSAGTHAKEGPRDQANGHERAEA